MMMGSVARESRPVGNRKPVRSVAKMKIDDREIRVAVKLPTREGEN